MILVQEYLVTNSLRKLREEHGVKYNIRNHKISLNYSNTKSRKNDFLARQCRGLILRPEWLGGPEQKIHINDKVPLGKTVILARPFDRFFNYGEKYAADVNFSDVSTTVYEKLDGTLCIVYYDDYLCEWSVATRVTPDASEKVTKNKKYIFRTLFDEALYNITKKDFVTWSSSTLFRDATYMFELTSKYNKTLIEYGEPKISLLGSRKTKSGKEVSSSFVQAQIKIPSANRHRFNSCDTLISFVSGRNPKKHEGVVVCDNDFNRVKIKSAGYLTLSKINSGKIDVDKNLIELILLNDIEKIINFLPGNIMIRANEFKEKYKFIIKLYNENYKYSIKEANKVIGNPVTDKHKEIFIENIKLKNGWLEPSIKQYNNEVLSLEHWIRNNKQKNGRWTNVFINTIISQITSKHNLICDL